MCRGLEWNVKRKDEEYCSWTQHNISTAITADLRRKCNGLRNHLTDCRFASWIIHSYPKSLPRRPHRTLLCFIVYEISIPLSFGFWFTVYVKCFSWNLIFVGFDFNFVEWRDLWKILKILLAYQRNYNYLPNWRDSRRFRVYLKLITT